MTIDSRWLQKDFKQKYFLYCKTCIIDNISPKTFAQKENKLYIRQIEIKEL
jgi:hypothetical protein